MLSITDEELVHRMRFDNPWWEGGRVPDDLAPLPERDYFPAFRSLVEQRDPLRAVVLLGPRRVGKTIMMQQAIRRLVGRGANPQDVLFLSADTPLYSGITLDKLVAVYRSSYGGSAGPKTIFVDEIQYLDDWEVHLKSLVDGHRDLKVVASGSAAAALARGARESGAGRFTEVLLPPLTFAEYLRLSGDPLAAHGDDEAALAARIGDLNRSFVDYLNFGGYPELACSEAARRNPARYVGQDIVEKVLLRDLPSLYGITDLRELQHLFRVLAFNSGQEVSLDGLSKASTVSKNTLKKYLDYLEASYLVRTVRRVDADAERFQRNWHFKSYLTAPCLRTALFGLIEDGDEAMGALAETAVFAQWFHDADMNAHLCYARDREGEIDIVSMRQARPSWVVEVKWSDRSYDRPQELRFLVRFCKRHGLDVARSGERPRVVVTTKTKSGRIVYDGCTIDFVPTALHCLAVGRDTVPERRRSHRPPGV